MSRDDAKGLVSHYIEEVWNNANLAALQDLTGPAYSYHLGGQPPRDQAAMQELLQAVHAAFPDWRVQIQDIVAEGNTVAARWNGTVTHEGIFNGIPPTSKRIAVCGINLYLIEDGKISQEWEQTDSLGILQQMGILSRPKPQADEPHSKTTGGDI